MQALRRPRLFVGEGVLPQEGPVRTVRPMRRGLYDDHSGSSKGAEPGPKPDEGGDQVGVEA